MKLADYHNYIVWVFFMKRKLLSCIINFVTDWKIMSVVHEIGYCILYFIPMSICYSFLNYLLAYSRIYLIFCIQNKTCIILIL